MNYLNRKILWCLLLDLKKDDLKENIFISKLASEADESLVNQVNCDVDRCLFEDDCRKLQLKELILSVFTSNKFCFSYIQGMHDIASVFLELFQSKEDDSSPKFEDIIEELDKINKIYDMCQLKELVFSLEKKLRSPKGRSDICFLVFEKFLSKYSIPFIYKKNGKNPTLNNALNCIGDDLLCLLGRSSPKIFKLFKDTRKDSSDPKTFMFTLSWIITWFSHNISIENTEILFYLFENFINNEPVYIIFFIEELIIQNYDKLIDFLCSHIGFDNLDDTSSKSDIYPFIHLYFQNLNFNDIEWNSIVGRSKRSFEVNKDISLKSRILWSINSGSNIQENSHLYIFNMKYRKQIIYILFILSGVVLAYLFFLLW
ncbi:TBC domain protein [Cryptosporidium ryanae]|uniref:TBC domain protein n=1 Tax=Cryptosporidium ryanae TaxID=515981 RepID=UPI00351A03C9|nr:TBC domain protein [Cryptosporidium ryanae]